MHRTTSAIRCGFMLGASLAAACASAQNYPTRPVRVIAPFTAGSAIDTLARVIGQKLADSWG
ncbi:MAG: tripartite tricarboxylate transporter substrate binding protein, partial [Betaproteobacteria bacterium]|nr:tripartite tricarboxylate transporter substrate binding protein [Betaproteobacteria bacterium]